MASLVYLHVVGVEVAQLAAALELEGQRLARRHVLPLHRVRARLRTRPAGGNCINIGLPGKSIL